MIDARLSGATDRDITQFSVAVSRRDTVRVTWKSFDPNQGAKVISLVSASAPVDPLVNATIFGTEVVAAKPSGRIPWTYAKWGVLLLSLVLGSAVIGGLTSFIRGVREKNKSIIVDNFFFTLGAGLLFLIFAAPLYQSWSKPEIPTAVADLKE